MLQRLRGAGGSDGVGSTATLADCRRVALSWSTVTARFLTYLWQRFETDDGMRLAAGLSYASLLSLVPLLAIVLGMLSLFPAFEGAQERVVATLLEDFLPETGDEIAERLQGFVSAASGVAGPGVVALLITALLLLFNINSAFNKIWRVTEPHSLAMRMLVYWALLTLGPLLVGASISISSLVIALSGEFGGGDLAEWLPISRLLAFVLSAAAFALAFTIVPNRRIEPLHAIIGGLVSASLFELLKWSFGIYLANFPAYEVIYGAMATVPIFLLWLFLTWMAVLLGAEVAAALPEFRATQARALRQWSVGQRLALALSLLARLRQAMRSGRQIGRHELTVGLPATPEEMDQTLNSLRSQSFIARTQGGRWVVGRDLSNTRLDELLRTLHLSLEPGQGWLPSASAAVRHLDAAGEGVRCKPLAQVLDEHEAEASPERDAKAAQ